MQFPKRQILIWHMAKEHASNSAVASLPCLAFGSVTSAKLLGGRGTEKGSALEI